MRGKDSDIFVRWSRVVVCVNVCMCRDAEVV